MLVWVKKIIKIFRTMQFLEKSKTTKPFVSPQFSKLIDCLKTGAYQNLMEVPLTSVAEHNSEMSSKEGSNEGLKEGS